MKEIIFGVVSGIVAAIGMGGRNDFDFTFEFVWKY